VVQSLVEVHLSCLLASGNEKEKKNFWRELHYSCKLGFLSASRAFRSIRYQASTYVEVLSALRQFTAVHLTEATCRLHHKNLLSTHCKDMIGLWALAPLRLHMKLLGSQALSWMPMTIYWLDSDLNMSLDFPFARSTMLLRLTVSAYTLLISQSLSCWYWLRWWKHTWEWLPVCWWTSL
jgi:hypothetical protein